MGGNSIFVMPENASFQGSFEKVSFDTTEQNHFKAFHMIDFEYETNISQKL